MARIEANLNLNLFEKQSRDVRIMQGIRFKSI